MTDDEIVRATSTELAAHVQDLEAITYYHQCVCQLCVEKRVIHEVLNKRYACEMEALSDVPPF